MLPEQIHRSRAGDDGQWKPQDGTCLMARQRPAYFIAGKRDCRRPVVNDKRQRLVPMPCNDLPLEVVRRFPGHRPSQPHHQHPIGQKFQPGGSAVSGDPVGHVGCYLLTQEYTGPGARAHGLTPLFEVRIFRVIPTTVDARVRHRTDSAPGASGHLRKAA